MSRRLPILMLFACALLLRLFMSWAAGDGFESRADWAPLVYSLSVAGLILSSLIALGVKDSEKIPAAALAVWLFQWFALGAAILREPGHALAAERLHYLVGLPAFGALFLLKKREGNAAVITRLAVLFTIGAAPPLPGFFALIELLSALTHAKLFHLALLTAFSQVCLFYIVSGQIFDILEKPYPNQAKTAEKS